MKLTLYASDHPVSPESAVHVTADSVVAVPGGTLAAGHITIAPGPGPMPPRTGRVERPARPARREKGKR